MKRPGWMTLALLAGALCVAGAPRTAEAQVSGTSVKITRTLTTKTGADGKVTSTWKVEVKCGSGPSREISMGQYLRDYYDAVHEAQDKGRAVPTVSASTTLESVMDARTPKTLVDTMTITTTIVVTGGCP